MQMTARNAASTPAQGAAGSPSIEVLISQLGDEHRAALTQAQVLSKVAGIVQASAVMGPGYVMPESEANAILAEATTPLTPMQVAIHGDVQDPNYHVNLEYVAALFACHCVGKARSELANQLDWQVQQGMAGTNLAGVTKKHVDGPDHSSNSD